MNTYLSHRLKEVFLNGKWIANTNYREQLDLVTWKQAIQKVDNLNTIAALVFHINYYLKGLNRVFEGGTLDIKDIYSFDCPQISIENEWKQLVSDFLNNAEKFIKHVEQMDDQKLDQPFIDEKYGTYLRNIEAQIEHSYYHLGQISLIRKIIAFRGL